MVRRSSERVGISLSRSILELREFDNFILYSGLIDVPCKGKNTRGIVAMVNLKVN